MGGYVPLQRTWGSSSPKRGTGTEKGETHLPASAASPVPGPPPHWSLKGPAGLGAEPAEALSRGRAWANGRRGLGWARDGGVPGAGPGGAPREVRAGGANLAALSPWAGV